MEKSNHEFQDLSIEPVYYLKFSLSFHLNINSFFLTGIRKSPYIKEDFNAHLKPLDLRTKNLERTLCLCHMQFRFKPFMRKKQSNICFDVF